MSAGIADAVGLIRAVAERDSEGLQEVISSLDLLEARQMVSRLAYLAYIARSVAPDVPVDEWFTHLLKAIAEA